MTKSSFQITVSKRGYIIKYLGSTIVIGTSSINPKVLKGGHHTSAVRTANAKKADKIVTGLIDGTLPRPLGLLSDKVIMIERAQIQQPA